MGCLKDAGNFVVDTVNPITMTENVYDPLGLITGTDHNWLDQGWSMFKHLVVPDMRRDRELLTNASITPRRIIYGTCRVSGQLAYAETGGSSNKYLHVVVILAGHPCESIGEVYLDDKISTEYGTNVVIEKFTGTQTSACASLVAASNGLWTTDHKLMGCTYLYLKFTYSESKFTGGLPTIKAVVSGKKIYDPRNSTTAFSSNSALCCRDYMLLGEEYGGMGCDTSEVDDASVIAAANICDEQVVKDIGGTTYENRYACNGTISIDASPQSILESLSQSMVGVVLYNEGVWKLFAGSYSSPVATLDETWLNGGIGFNVGPNKNDKANTVKGVFVDPLDSWAAKDFPVVPLGNTPPNSTYWNSVSAPVYVKTNSYTTGNYVTVGDVAYKAIISVPAKTDGTNSPPNNTYWAVVANYDPNSVYSTNQVVQILGKVYSAKSVVPVNNPYITDDGGEELALNLTLNFTTSPTMAQRIAKIMLEKSRRGMSLTYPCNFKAFKIAPNDIVQINNAILGWSNKTFRVQSWGFSQLGGIDLKLVEEDATVYSWVAGDVSPVTPPATTLLPDPTHVDPPTNVTTSLIVVVLNGGTTSRVDLRIDWVAGGDELKYIVEYKLSSDSTWTSAGTTTELYYIIQGLPANTYDVRVKGMNTVNAVSTWASYTAVSVPNSDGQALDAVSGFAAVFSGNLVKLSWTANSEADRSYYEIRQGSVWASATVVQSRITSTSWTFRPTGAGATTYLIKCFDTTGNESVTASSVVVTIPLAGPPTALTCASILQGISVTVTYPQTEDIDYCEIYAGSTNDRNAGTTVLVGMTRDGKFDHNALGNVVTRYYWARTKNVFGEFSTWYPVSATSGVQGAVVSNPSEIIKLLNTGVDNTILTNYLNGVGSFTDVLDTYTPAAQAGTGQTGAFATKTIMLIQADKQVQLKAGNDDVSAQIDIIDTMIGLKLNATGTAGPGMVIAWTDETHTKSTIQFQSDTLLVSRPDGTGAKNIITTGMVNGVDTVGINAADLVVDGSILARHIGVGELVVGGNVTMGPNAYISWVNVTDQPTIPVLPSYITSTKITATTIETPTIIAGTITGSQFILGNGTTYGKIETYDYANRSSGIQIQDGVSPSVNIKGGTITGSVLQTGISGNRIVIDTTASSTYFKAFDGSNVEKVRLGTASWGASYALEINNGYGVKVTGSNYYLGNTQFSPNGNIYSAQFDSEAVGSNIFLNPIGSGTPSTSGAIQGMLRTTSSGLYYYTGSAWTKIA